MATSLAFNKAYGDWGVLTGVWHLSDWHTSVHERLAVNGEYWRMWRLATAFVSPIQLIPSAFPSPIVHGNSSHLTHNSLRL